MNPWKRMSIALAILLAGFALVPFVALPHESFSWRLFAGAYGSAPALAVSYDLGAPGSVFTVTGYNFPAGRTVTISVNGRALGTVQASETGTFSLALTTDEADAGVYLVWADGRAATTRFELAAGAPLREGDDELSAFVVPAGIAGARVSLPLLRQ